MYNNIEMKYILSASIAAPFVYAYIIFSAMDHRLIYLIGQDTWPLNCAPSTYRGPM